MNQIKPTSVHGRVSNLTTTLCVKVGTHELSTNIQLLAVLSLLPDVDAAAQVAASVIAAAQSLLVPPPTTVHVFSIDAAAHEAVSVVAAGQLLLTPPPRATLHDSIIYLSLEWTIKIP